ncbi:sugar ABC transporter substrate-binding protein [Actinokineospora sp. G85]|uniref:sugar ABC transporter substrate-binding protein n=1 Tax=Actinokineospora sp. G85 TaxID=3406626 RepID=UPI003C75728F
MARTAREPTFLPLTLTTAARLAVSPRPAPSAGEAHWSAVRADAAAAEVWATLLAGCADTGRHQLPRRLHDLCAATSACTGPAAPARQSRLARARARITEAVTTSDGADFAEAFVDFDQVVASALAQALNRTESPAR